MAVKKKQSSSGKSKRKAGPKTRQKHKANVRAYDTLNDAVDTNGENGLADSLVGDEMGDPDANVLAHEEEILEDDEINIKSPEIAAEMSEDPVRLYLREIGQVKLLDADSEFRLATMIEANRLLNVFRRQPVRRGMTLACSAHHSILSEMYTSWERLLEDADRIHSDPPDLGLMLTEAQALRAGWESDAPSYLRAFLDNGKWGTDPIWDDFARKSYSVFLGFYLLPFDYAS